jgi:hypothetical protein
MWLVLLLGCNDIGLSVPCPPLVVDRIARGDDQYGVSAREMLDQANAWGPIDVRFEPVDESAADLAFDDVLTVELDGRGRAEVVHPSEDPQCPQGGGSVLQVGVDLTVSSALGFVALGRGLLSAGLDEREGEIWVSGSVSMPGDLAPAAWASTELHHGCDNASGPAAPPMTIQLDLPGFDPDGGSGPLGVRASTVRHGSPAPGGVCYQDVLAGEGA